jgi:hypothetical protein
MELQMADVKKENEMLFASEDRVRRLLDDSNELKAVLRAKDRDIVLLTE